MVYSTVSADSKSSVDLTWRQVLNTTDVFRINSELNTPIQNDFT